MPEQYVGISDVNGDKLLINADGSLPVAGSIDAGAVDQGTPAATADAWPTKLVDSAGVNVANVFPSGAVKVQVDGTSVATAWPIMVTDGSNVAGVTGGTGVALLVATGSEISFTTLNAQSAVANGTANDFASCYSSVSMVVVPNGTLTAGKVVLEGSLNGTNWVKINETATDIDFSTGSTTRIISVTGVALRHFRGVITDAIVGGTVTAQIGVS